MGILILDVLHLSSAVCKSKVIIHLVLKGDCDERYTFWSSALQQTSSVLTEVNYLQCRSILKEDKNTAVMFTYSFKKRLQRELRI